MKWKLIDLDLFSHIFFRVRVGCEQFNLNFSGEETVVIPEILDWFANFEMFHLPALYESGVTPELMDDAMSAFLSEVWFI